MASPAFLRSTSIVPTPSSQAVAARCPTHLDDIPCETTPSDRVTPRPIHSHAVAAGTPAEEGHGGLRPPRSPSCRRRPHSLHSHYSITALPLSRPGRQAQPAAPLTEELVAFTSKSARQDQTAGMRAVVQVITSAPLASTVVFRIVAFGGPTRLPLGVQTCFCSASSRQSPSQRRCDLDVACLALASPCPLHNVPVRGRFQSFQKECSVLDGRPPMPPSYHLTANPHTTAMERDNSPCADIYVDMPSRVTGNRFLVHWLARTRHNQRLRHPHTLLAPPAHASRAMWIVCATHRAVRPCNARAGVVRRLILCIPQRLRPRLQLAPRHLSRGPGIRVRV